jgi:hypothetical protein
MSLTTPNTIRTLRRKLYVKAKQIRACRGVKHIGKPCTGELYARFDEGGLVSCDDDSAREAPPDERGGNR